VKKQALTAALLSALLLTAIAGAFTVDSAAASDYDPEIAVSSPIEGKTYTINNIKLQFTVHLNQTGVLDLGYYRINYYLDGKALGVPLEPNVVSGDITMKVANGDHIVEILAQAEYFYSHFPPGPWWYSSQVVVRFAVDSGVGPGVSIHGLEEYKTNEVSLHVIVDVPGVGVSYSLDGQRSVSVPDSELDKYDEGYLCSVAFVNLTDGAHTLAGYATDSLGYTGVAEKAFTVNTAVSQPEPDGSQPEPGDLEPEPDPSSTAILIAVAVAVLPTVIVITGLLAYFKKRQKMKPLN